MKLAQGELFVPQETIPDIHAEEQEPVLGGRERRKRSRSCKCDEEGAGVLMIQSVVHEIELPIFNRVSRAEHPPPQTQREGERRRGS